MSEESQKSKMKNYLKHSKILKRHVPYYVAATFLLLLMLQTPPLITHAETASPTMQTWIQDVNLLPTPGIGCWVATYPNVAWQLAPCSSFKPGPETVGNGYDDSADSINYNIADATGSFTSESGFSSESDSIKGTNWYSLQANSQTFSTTYGGKSTTGWEQFAFINQGTSAGYAFIQYWMLGYHSSYGNCPAGWIQSSGDCYENSNTVSTGYENPAYLNKYTLTGSVSSGSDTSKFCDSNKGKCYSVSGSDSLNLVNNWWDTEFNVFGYGVGSQANFNTGITLGVETNNFERGQGCSTTGYTGETNNLNLNNNCAGGLQQDYITFSESH
jgi:hypothetical protein